MNIIKKIYKLLYFQGHDKKCFWNCNEQMLKTNESSLPYSYPESQRTSRKISRENVKLKHFGSKSHKVGLKYFRFSIK